MLMQQLSSAPSCSARLRPRASLAPRGAAAWGRCNTSGSSRRQQSRSAGLVVEAVATQSAAAQTLKLTIPYRVSFGETVKLVGSGSVMGDWNADNGLQLEWSEGDVWVADVPIDQGHYEFKCVVYNTNTRSVSRWEDGGNRVLDVTTEPGSWLVECQWGTTEGMGRVFTPAPAPPAPPAPEPEPELQAVPAAFSAEAAISGAKVEAADALAAAAAEAAVEGGVVASASGADVAASEAAVEAAAEAGTSGQPANALPTFLALEGDSKAEQEAAGGSGAVAALVATTAAACVAAAVYLAPGAVPGPSAPGAAGLSSSATSLFSDTALASAQVRSQVQTQLAALQSQVAAAGPALQAHVESVQGSVAALQSQVAPALQAHVESVQGGVAALQSQVAAAAPALQAQVESVQGSLSAMQPALVNSVAALQGQAGELQARATAVVADASVRVGGETPAAPEFKAAPAPAAVNEQLSVLRRRG